MNDELNSPAGADKIKVPNQMVAYTPRGRNFMLRLIWKNQYSSVEVPLRIREESDWSDSVPFEIGFIYWRARRSDIPQRLRTKVR